MRWILKSPPTNRKHLPSMLSTEPVARESPASTAPAQENVDDTAHVRFLPTGRTIQQISLHIAGHTRYNRIEGRKEGVDVAGEGGTCFPLDALEVRVLLAVQSTAAALGASELLPRLRSDMELIDGGDGPNSGIGAVLGA